MPLFCAFSPSLLISQNIGSHSANLPLIQSPYSCLSSTSLALCVRGSREWLYWIPFSVLFPGIYDPFQFYRSPFVYIPTRIFDKVPKACQHFDRLWIFTARSGGRKIEKGRTAKTEVSANRLFPGDFARQKQEVHFANGNYRHAALKMRNTFN